MRKRFDLQLRDEYLTRRTKFEKWKAVNGDAHRNEVKNGFCFSLQDSRSENELYCEAATRRKISRRRYQELAVCEGEIYIKIIFQQ